MKSGKGRIFLGLFGLGFILHFNGCSSDTNGDRGAFCDESVQADLQAGLEGSVLALIDDLSSGRNTSVEGSADPDFCRPGYSAILQCGGTGLMAISHSCRTANQGLEGREYLLEGRAELQNCGPSGSLSGSLAYTVQLGPLPFSCLENPACASAIPLLARIGVSPEEALRFEGTALDELSLTFTGELAQDGEPGVFSSFSGRIAQTPFVLLGAKLVCGADLDADGVLDAEDNCPRVANRSQTDDDADGIGDVCDNCAPTLFRPEMANPDQANRDGDLFGDLCDPCPADPINECPGPQIGIRVCENPVPPPTEACTRDEDCIPPTGFAGGYCANQVCEFFTEAEPCDIATSCTQATVENDCEAEPTLKEFCPRGRCCYSPVNCSVEFDGCDSETHAGCEPGEICGPSTGNGSGCECFPGEAPPPPPPALSSSTKLQEFCPDCICGDCLLQTGEDCEPLAEPGGPGLCPEGQVCEGCACVPPPPPDPIEACADMALVACELGSDLLNPDAVPEEIAQALPPSPICADLSLGECSEFSLPGGTVACCAPGICGDLETPSCDLLGAVFGQEGALACANFFDGSCDAEGCCVPSLACPPIGDSESGITCQDAAEMCGSACGPEDDPCAILSKGTAACQEGCCVASQPPPEPGTCGDQTCDSDEDCLSCELDCGPCGPPPPGPLCPDQICGPEEDCLSCVEDCGACPPPPPPPAM